MDEAHQAVAETYQLVLESLLVRPIRPASSASQPRPDALGPTSTRTSASPLLRPQKVTLDVPGYDNPVDYLIDEGYLARPRFEPLFYERRTLSALPT